MTTVLVKNNSVQARSFIEYARMLPFATVVEKKKEAVAECNGRPASEFFDELRYQVKKHFENA